MSNNMSKKRQVIDFLATGKGLTAAEAKSRCDVSNFRACMSAFKEQVEGYDNWSIRTETTSNGSTRYLMYRVALVCPTTEVH